MGYSKKWINWIAKLDLRTCMICRLNHGRIFSINDDSFLKPPIHENGRCETLPLKTIMAGSSTISGSNGADWFLKYFNRLPDYYISKQDAKKSGWISFKGNLSDVAPQKMIFGGEYKNREGKLPQASGRIWYEADINYTSGYRNNDRILFSNDGLIFVTYDHYKTFIEIE